MLQTWATNDEITATKLNNTGVFTSRARAYRNTSAQTISSGSETKVQLNAESYDGDSEFDSITNYRFTATVAGYYQVSSSVKWDNLGDGEFATIRIKMDGTTDLSENSICNGVAGGVTISNVISDIIYLAAGHYIELYALQANGGDRDIQNGTEKTFMAVHQLSK